MYVYKLNLNFHETSNQQKLNQTNKQNLKNLKKEILTYQDKYQYEYSNI